MSIDDCFVVTTATAQYISSEMTIVSVMRSSMSSYMFRFSFSKTLDEFTRGLSKSKLVVGRPASRDPDLLPCKMSGWMIAYRMRERWNSPGIVADHMIDRNLIAHQ